MTSDIPRIPRHDQIARDPRIEVVVRSREADIKGDFESMVTRLRQDLFEMRRAVKPGNRPHEEVRAVVLAPTSDQEVEIISVNDDTVYFYPKPKEPSDEVEVLAYEKGKILFCDAEGKEIAEIQPDAVGIWTVNGITEMLRRVSRTNE